MGIIFALNGLSYLAVSLLSFYIYFSFCKLGEVACKVGNILGVNGIFYLLMAFLNFSWVFKAFEPNAEDFVLIVTVLAVVSSILVLYLTYKITGNRNLIYLLVLFITTVFAINFSVKAFFAATLGASYLLAAIVFLGLVFRSDHYLKKAGLTGLIYSGSSLALLILMIFGAEPHILFWFIPSCLMFFVFYFVYRGINDVGIDKEKYGKKGRITILSYAPALIKVLIFTTTMGAFILVSAVSIHELGHALVAQYYGCGQFKAVIYDIIEPHTEIKCDSYYNDTILTLGGLTATLAVALVFILTGAQFTMGLSYLLFGFGLLISYGDLVDLKVSRNIVALILFLSLIIITVSVVRMTAYFLKQQVIFDDGSGVSQKGMRETAPKVRKI